MAFSLGGSECGRVSRADATRRSPLNDFWKKRVDKVSFTIQGGREGREGLT